jgi:hypothetical protein
MYGMNGILGVMGAKVPFKVLFKVLLKVPFKVLLKVPFKVPFKVLLKVLLKVFSINAMLDTAVLAAKPKGL